MDLVTLILLSLAFGLAEDPRPTPTTRAARLPGANPTPTKIRREIRREIHHLDRRPALTHNPGTQ